MQELTRRLAKLWSDSTDEGQGLAEYALILGLIAIVAIISLVFLGDAIADLMSMIGATVNSVT